MIPSPFICIAVRLANLQSIAIAATTICAHRSRPLLASPQALSGDRLGRNRAVWSGIAANPGITIEDLVAQYSRYHFGADLEEDMT